MKLSLHCLLLSISQHNLYYLVRQKDLTMKDSEIFSKRLNKVKPLGGIRFASTSISPKKQPPIFEKGFRLINNNFNNKLNLEDKVILFPLEKVQKTTGYTSSLSPNQKSLRVGNYKLCHSKNVCVLSNLNQIQFPESAAQNYHENRNTNGKISRISRQKQELLIFQGLSPRYKKSKKTQFSKTTTCSFNLRKVSSSQSCRQKQKIHQKILDPWHNEDHSQDPDIIFYR